ncbi:MAG: RNA polymerase sigma factor [Bacteroidota bacterium]
MAKQANNCCDEGRYKALFEEQAEHLRNFLYYKCGNLELAADLMQEAFLRLWRDCHKVPIDKARAFLFRIANNLFLDHARHQQVVQKFKSQHFPVGTNESPEFQYETEEFRQQLEAYINALPETAREVFLLSRIEKMTYKEIAERLEVSVKTVEKRMSKALAELRKLHPKI